MIKVIMAAVLVLALLWPAIDQTEASADPASTQQKAESLKEMGLFAGSDRGFELDRQPTRAEALVMLLRLLGKAEEAVAKYESNPQDKPSHPFTDVPAWAQPYVAYAWQNGLVAGVSPTRLGADEPVSEPQYLTFVLRALGYDDRQGDFEWNKAAKAAEAAGLFAGRANMGSTIDSPFIRADMLDISYAALDARLKYEDITLLYKLIRENAVDLQAAIRAGVISHEGVPLYEKAVEGSQAINSAELDRLGRKVISLPIEVIPDSKNQGWIDADLGELSRQFPQWKQVMSTGLIVFDSEWTDEERERIILLALLKEKLNYFPIVNASLREYMDLSGKPAVMSQQFDENPTRMFRAYAILDAQDRVIAYTTLDDLDLDKSEWLIYTYPDPDACELKSEALLDEARELADGAVYLTHAYANPDEAAPQLEVPLELIGQETTTTMPDGSVSKAWINNYVIKEADLPFVAQTATHRSGIGIWIFSGEHNPEMYATMPIVSRLSYMLYNTGKISSTGLHYGEKMPWELDLSFPSLDAEPTKRGVMFVFMEDGNGHLLAYTSFYYPVKAVQKS